MSQYLSMPNALLNDENVVKMLTLLFPCSESREPTRMKKYTAEKSLFAKIFRENNYDLRERFFNDPLAKFLWGKIFTVDAAEITINHLRRIRSLPNYGEEKYQRLRKNMVQVENEMKFKMLPDIANKPDGVKVFSEEEALNDLVQNGKYNKKQGKKTREELDRIQQKRTVASDI